MQFLREKSDQTEVLLLDSHMNDLLALEGEMFNLAYHENYSQIS